MGQENEPEEQDKSEAQRSLDWRDYVAIPLAMLQTVLLPIVLLILVIIALVLVSAFLL